MIRASAPGKLFLIGEYAVLDGAPALLGAVDRRVTVTLTPSHDARWSLTAPNLGLNALDLGADARRRDGHDNTARARLAVFEAVHAESAAALGERLPPQQVTIDSSDFARDGHKLGLGSSAAVAAALCAALSRAAGEALTRVALAHRAIAAHRRAQNGAGSGGDVATSVYGGLLSYTRDTRPVPLAWPTELAFLAVVTGDGARTPDLVGRVKAYAARAADAYARDMGVLASLSRQAAGCLNDASRFLALAHDYFTALRRLDVHAEAGIVTPQHDRLAERVASAGGVFKTSGAGGGDVGLVFVRRGAAEQRLRAALADTHAQIVDLTLGAAGVTCETGPALGQSPIAIT